MEKTANINSRSSPLVDNNRRNVISGAYFFLVRYLAVSLSPHPYKHAHAI